MPDGTVAALSMAPYMDTEIAHAVFTRTIAAVNTAVSSRLPWA